MPSKQRVSLSLAPAVIAEIRARYPAATLSQAVETLVREGLRREDLELRLRNLDVVCRALLLMLADHVAGGDEREAERLKNSYAQKAVSRMRRLEAKRRADQGDPGQGPGQGAQDR